MQLSIAALLAVSALVLPSAVLAALTPAQVVNNIRIVTAESQNINNTLTGLTTTSTSSSVAAMGQNITASFQTIITNLNGDVSAMQATPSFSDVDAGPIVEALNNFVLIHQALLATLIGKHGIFAEFSATAPIAQILRSLEAIIDSFAFAMIDLIPTKKGSVTKNKSDLDSSVGNTITIIVIHAHSNYISSFLH
ncbi:hypothetical protein B0H19DRAFT_1073879 [Mycena capillaripes]|nr:hypothetical protein B0H19DRAFT_1073879 [Mycena capillaripes]